MNLEKDMKWVSVGNNTEINQRKDIKVLEQELLDIKNNLEVLDDKRRMLANLAKLY